jgi:hypothetical protein
MTVGGEGNEGSIDRAGDVEKPTRKEMSSGSLGSVCAHEMWNSSANNEEDEGL